MDGCGDRKLEIVLVGLGIIHMCIEWVLGKRAARVGGPGSLLAALFTIGAGVYSLIRARLRRGPPKGV